MDNVEEIKARIDIADLVSESVQLRRAGKNYTGFCPFHSNTRTPAFVVFPETGTWRCFGQCAEGGDIFKFVMKKEGWDFPEALRRLADRAGVQLRTPSPQEQAAKEQHGQLRALLEEAVTFFRHQLISTEAGKPVLDYLTGRGLTDETIQAFGIGYAPDDWDALSKHFLEQGHSAEELIEVGLISERETGGHYDRFRHRVMFPIRDGRGRMAGFGARALKEDEPAKYLNSPQTPLFDKGSLLYGLDMARKAIRAEEQAVIVEGYMDVIGLYQAGFRNAVSPMGTALTEPQLRTLKRFTRRIVLALDADAAGNQATLRGVDVARRALDREADPVFDPRGLLRHEGRLQADIRVTTLPEGKDPDEIVMEDAEAWPKVVKAARPIVEHVMYNLAAERDLNDAKVKTEIAEQVMPLIGDIPSAIERDSYTQKLARLLKVDERALMEQRSQPVRRRPKRQSPAAPTEATTSALPLAAGNHFKLEAHCLSIIIRDPELIYRVTRALKENGLDEISSADFEHSDLQEMFRLSLDALKQDAIEPRDYALYNLPLPLIDRADELLRHSHELDPNQERVFEDLMRTLILLRKRNMKQRVEQMRFLQEQAQEEGDLRASEYQPVMVQNMQVMQRLDKALARYNNRAFISAN
ncbi:MAG: DNA primase [Chloroflexi bacterium]|nr:DNA primase [Chloroflexota bacterium]